MKLRGIASIEVGDTDGGDMGSTLAALGGTYKNTAELTFPEADDVEIYSEESDDPVETIADIASAKEFEWEIFDFDADNMVILFGGTKDTGPPVTWSAPATAEDVEQSIKITDKNGNTIEIARAKLFPSISAKLTRNDIGRIKIRAKILAPTSDASVVFTEAT